MMEKSTADRLLDAIAIAILDVTRTGCDHFYLYVEVLPGVISPTFYQVFDDGLLYVRLPECMGDLIYQLWLDHRPDGPWQAMRFEMIGGWYKAEFDRFDTPAFLDPAYRGEIDEADTNVANDQGRRRLEEAVGTRFGDLPITYVTVSEGGYQAQVTFLND